jgi:hypothetical protein
VRDLSEPHERIAALHELFLSEFGRQADDRAVQVLKEIRAEAWTAGINRGETPTASKEGRLRYSQAMFDRASEHPLTLDRALNIMREIRAER